jgi:hypothetical protein
MKPKRVYSQEPTNDCCPEPGIVNECENLPLTAKNSDCMCDNLVVRRIFRHKVEKSNRWLDNKSCVIAYADVIRMIKSGG